MGELARESSRRRRWALRRLALQVYVGLTFIFAAVGFLGLVGALILLPLFAMPDEAMASFLGCFLLGVVMFLLGAEVGW